MHVRPRLDDALEWATTLADVPERMSGDSGNPGVLVTGSVIAAGEARALLVSDAGATEREEVDWDADDHGGTLDELGADTDPDEGDTD